MRWNLLFYVFSKALKVFYWCVEFVLNLQECAEIFLRMWWICAETSQEMRWNFIVFTFSQKCWNFSLDVLNLRWNFVKNALKLHSLTFSQERWNFSTAVVNLCWNFARNALKFFYFRVFSKCWNFSLDVLNLRWKLIKTALKFYYFTFSQKRWKFSTDVLNLCWILQECAENLLFSRFLKNAEIFLRMWWICAETLQEMRWNFMMWWIFAFARFLLFSLKSAETSLRMCWICVET